MSLRINLNTAALNAHRQLQGTDNALAASIEKLSSGYRINRAADDPAGLAISENLRAQGIRTGPGDSELKRCGQLDQNR